MDSDSGRVSGDAALEEEISLLEVEVGSLKEERDRALTIADNSSKRSTRLRASVEKLNDNAFKAMRLGDESAARKLLQEKATVSIAQTKAHSRAEANVALAKKLNDILRIRQTKLINLYSSKKPLQDNAAAPAAEPNPRCTPEPRPATRGPHMPQAEALRTPGGSGEEEPLGLSSRNDDESPSWEDDGDDCDSLARSLTGHPFSSEDDLEEAFLELERKTLERMLEISAEGDDNPPGKEDKPS
eukprot:evm.model.scf_955.2 EVM.evm.TU.scf_955.2   scf_955:13354-16719(+)